MNKYQEALDNAVHDIDYKYHDFGEYIPKERLDEIDLLQELVDKETPKDIIELYLKCVNKDKKSRPRIEEAIRVIQRELDLYIKEK